MTALPVPADYHNPWPEAPAPDKVTTGIAKAGPKTWRYWLRRNSATTWGPHRPSRQLAEEDRAEAALGAPRARLPKSKYSKIQRRKLGLCWRCDTKPPPGRAQCERHLKEDRDTQEKRRRDRGQRPLAEYLALPVRERIARKLTAKAIDARINLTERCQIRGCGLLLPCYGKHRIEEYVGERTWVE